MGREYVGILLSGQTILALLGLTVGNCFFFFEKKRMAQVDRSSRSAGQTIHLDKIRYQVTAEVVNSTYGCRVCS